MIALQAPDVRKRFFALMGKDEYTGGIHFLPTFLRSMHPPTDIQPLDILLYYVHCIQYVTAHIDYHAHTSITTRTHRLPRAHIDDRAFLGVT